MLVVLVGLGCGGGDDGGTVETDTATPGGDTANETGADVAKDTATGDALDTLDATPTDTADATVDSRADSASDSAVDSTSDTSDAASDTTPPPPGTWRETGGPLGGLIMDFAFNAKGDVYLVNDRVYAFKRPKLGTWQFSGIQTNYVDASGFEVRLRSGPADEIYLWPGRTENALSKSIDDGATWNHLGARWRRRNCLSRLRGLRRRARRNGGRPLSLYR